METPDSTAVVQCKRSLSRRIPSTSSFRLRCPSLNSLRLRRIFHVFDQNRDGTITIHELGQALNLLGLDADLAELTSMVEAYIKPGNAGLSFEDFEALHRSLNDAFFGLDNDDDDHDGCSENIVEDGGAESSCCDNPAGAKKAASQEESDLSEAFKVFDEDGDGYICARELQVVLQKLGLQEGRELDRVEQMISSFDRNHDGRVDFFEFKDMMRTIVMIPTA